MRILFCDSTDGFSPTRIKEKATGGILGSLTIIPRYLASKGHEVYVSTVYPDNVEIDGVKYVPNGSSIPKWDVVVLNRNGVTASIVNYSKSINAKVVWWLHDIVDTRYLDDNSYIYVDKIIALSQYCKQTYSEFYEIKEDKFVVIPNGVDKSIFYPGKYEDRQPHKMIMASALIKGFAPIETMWTTMRRHFPQSELTIFSSQKLHDLENNAAQKMFLDGMEKLRARIQAPVPQPVLADIMRKSWALLMPNSYPEICSNLLLQARACGLPVITTDIGSSKEFIENEKNGVITPGYPHDLWLWIKNYAQEVAKLGKNADLHKVISDNASQGVESWDEIGGKWDEFFKSLVVKN